MPNRIIYNDPAQNMQVQVFATDGESNQPLQVDEEGNLLITSNSRKVVEKRVEYKESEKGADFTTNAIMVSEYSDYTLFAHKKGGTGSVQVKIQVAPGNIEEYFIDAPDTLRTIGPDETFAFVPTYYSHVVRLSVTGLEENGVLETWINAQC